MFTLKKINKTRLVTIFFLKTDYNQTIVDVVAVTTPTNKNEDNIDIEDDYNIIFSSSEYSPQAPVAFTESASSNSLAMAKENSNVDEG